MEKNRVYRGPGTHSQLCCPKPPSLPLHPPHPRSPAPYPAPGSCPLALLPSSSSLIPLDSSAEACQKSGKSAKRVQSIAPGMTFFLKALSPAYSPELLWAWLKGVGQGLLLHFWGQPRVRREGPTLQRASVDLAYLPPTPAFQQPQKEVLPQIPKNLVGKKPFWWP